MKMNVKAFVATDTPMKGQIIDTPHQYVKYTVFQYFYGLLTAEEMAKRVAEVYVDDYRAMSEQSKAA